MHSNTKEGENLEFPLLDVWVEQLQQEALAPVEGLGRWRRRRRRVPRGRALGALRPARRIGHPAAHEETQQLAPHQGQREVERARQRGVRGAAPSGAVDGERGEGQLRRERVERRALDLHARAAARGQEASREGRVGRVDGGGRKGSGRSNCDSPYPSPRAF